jgi:hypothetical protein
LDAALVPGMAMARCQRPTTASLPLLTVHGRSAWHSCPCSVRSAAALRQVMIGAEAHTSTRRFTLVDALRGFAAFFVMLHHASQNDHVNGLMAQVSAWVPHVLEQGDSGVAVFFVLSGFVISHSVARSRITLPFVGRFMLRRSLRHELRIGLLSCWLSSPCRG